MPPDVNVSAGTCAALRADLTLRVLLRTKYDRDSRHSKVAIAWALSRAEKFTRRMLESIEQPTAGSSVKLNMVELLGLRNRALICYDMFLEGCEASVRSEVEQSPDRPVHMAVRRGKVFFVQRGDKKVERMVTSQYNEFREFDKGPLPYFRDMLNPPVYDLGVRLERAEGADSDADLYASSSEEGEDGGKGEDVKSANVGDREGSSSGEAMGNRGEDEGRGNASACTSRLRPRETELDESGASVLQEQ